MAHRQIVVHLFLLNDGPDRVSGLGVGPAQRLHLVPQVLQNHALHRDGRCRNGAPTQDARQEAERESSESAQVIAAAPADPSALEFRQEDRPVSPLVRLEFDQLWYEVPGREPGAKICPA